MDGDVSQRREPRARTRPRAFAAAALIGAALLAIAAAPAWAAEGDRSEVSATGGPFTDTVQPGPSPAHPPGSQAAPPSYQLSDGSVVRVQVAPEYSDGAMLQRLLVRLGSLMHGNEMNRLTVVIATPAGLQQACGGANACYFTFDETMMVPGGATTNSMPFEMLVAHEYGHHIELNRSTNGWNAIGLGARHWATYEHVCEGVSAGQLFPGDQGAHYWENPGEAFAQAYAFHHYPNAVPWWWSFAEPDAGAYAAITADVASGSPGGKAKWARRLAAGNGRASKTIRTRTDGPFRARLNEPRSGHFDLVVVSAEGKVLKRARPKRNKAAGGNTVEQLSYEVCGGRSVRLEVRRRSGRGKFTVRVSRP